MRAERVAQVRPRFECRANHVDHLEHRRCEDVESRAVVEEKLGDLAVPDMRRGTERALRLYRRAASGAVETLNPNLDDPVRPNDVLYVRESIF